MVGCDLHSLLLLTWLPCTLETHSWSPVHLCALFNQKVVRSHNTNHWYVRVRRTHGPPSAPDCWVGTRGSTVARTSLKSSSVRARLSRMLSCLITLFQLRLQYRPWHGSVGGRPGSHLRKAPRRSPRRRCGCGCDCGWRRCRPSKPTEDFRKLPVESLQFIL